MHIAKCLALHASGTVHLLPKGVSLMILLLLQLYSTVYCYDVSDDNHIHYHNVPSQFRKIFIIIIILLHLLSNSENREHLKISGMLIVYWPITIKFRIRKQTSKPQTNYSCCLRFSFLTPYWLFPLNTITFHKYFWCSRFCEFHSKR